METKTALAQRLTVVIVRAKLMGMDRSYPATLRAMVRWLDHKGKVTVTATRVKWAEDWFKRELHRYPGSPSSE